MALYAHRYVNYVSFFRSYITVPGNGIPNFVSGIFLLLFLSKKRAWQYKSDRVHNKRNGDQNHPIENKMAINFEIVKKISTS